MRAQIVEDLQSRVKSLKNKRNFYENLDTKHIPAMQVFLEHLSESARGYCNKSCIELDDQIQELEDAIDDLCGINK